jgi:hypothetical protein
VCLFVCLFVCRIVVVVVARRMSFGQQQPVAFSSPAISAAVACLLFLPACFLLFVWSNLCIIVDVASIRWKRRQVAGELHSNGW